MIVLLAVLLGLAGVPAGYSSGAPANEQRADRIVIVKSTHTLILMSHGQVLKTYQVALGRGGKGAKRHSGDRETPEGEYVIDAKNPHSRFHRALHISYPNAQDRKRAREQGTNPGGLVEIHGVEEKWAWLGPLHRVVDWTAGCIAVTNPEIEEIYKLVPVGTPVTIAPAETGPTTTMQRRFAARGTRGQWSASCADPGGSRAARRRRVMPPGSRRAHALAAPIPRIAHQDGAPHGASLGAPPGAGG
ncbi:MAG: L,D-transpeptidase family protein [Terriglobales bacterium]